jgi:hypothetical protein
MNRLCAFSHQVACSRPFAELRALEDEVCDEAEPLARDLKTIENGNGRRVAELPVRPAANSGDIA